MKPVVSLATGFVVLGDFAMKWLVSCCCAAWLAACMPIEMETLHEAAPQAPIVAQALSASDVAKMQSPDELGYRLTRKSGDETTQNASPNKKSSKKAKAKQPEKRDIRYFDKLRRPEVRPTKNGFYREIIGRTADGRLVVQDFYQNDDVPFTSPYIAAKDAKLRIFGDVSAIDSRVAWYAPNGSLLKMAVYANGVEQGEVWLFANNRVSAYVRDDLAGVQAASAVGDVLSGSLKMQFFYPNGALMAERLTQNGNSNILFYYENGSAMLRLEDTPRQSTRLAWDRAGKTVAPQDIRADLLAVQTRIQADLKAMKREKDLMNDLIE